ncbi:hypothetical protein HID58_079874 [Brassica napus]|uniref:Uncharacterized protein n=1 Tax=Brassica napus TaxID=3708 RepID=A0ABQ7Y5R7_BRANA|nr:hypothetical protein HID58_079874 [Brassica napus]
MWGKCVGIVTMRRRLFVRSTVINVDGLSATGKNIIDIKDRNWLVRSMFDNQVTAKGDNTSRFLDSQFAAMLPWNYPKFKKQCGASDVVVDKPLAVEKIKGVAQNTNPANAGITTSLCITLSIIADEAQRAAIMIYKFLMKL